MLLLAVQVLTIGEYTWRVGLVVAEIELQWFFGEWSEGSSLCEVGSDAFATGIFLHIVKLY